MSMKPQRFLFIAIFLVLSSPVCLSQTKNKPVQANNPSNAKSSPAYAEVLLQKTELLSELESLLIDYKEDFPKVKELRYETGLLQKELDRILAVNPADASKLTTALGKLMVRRCELGANLWSLQIQFNDEHPDVKRAKRKLEFFDAAINEILQNK